MKICVLSQRCTEWAPSPSKRSRLKHMRMPPAGARSHL